MDKYNTQISKNNYAKIKGQDMTPEEIIGFLEEGALFRKFKNVLETAYPGKDLPYKLARGLSEITGVGYPNVLHKVNNWLKKDCGPKNREDLFQICFVLGLSEEDSNRLLASSSESGIHYRAPRELIYAFALRTGQDYETALRLEKELKPIYDETMKKAEEGRTLYTKQLREEFADVRTEAALRSFFQEHGSSLGAIHATAYKKFIELLGKLQQPSEDEEKYPMVRVVDEYFQMHVPKTRKSGDFSYLQKVIKKNWPSESKLTKMKNQKIDVSRKAMLLLFLITEDYEQDPAEDDDYDDLMEEDSMERLETRLNKIDIFLGNYGMELLDPGNPFDCLVLYALRAQEPEGTASDAVKSALKILFDGINVQDLQPDDDTIG